MPTIEELDKEIAGMQRNIDRLENVLIDLINLRPKATPISGIDIEKALKENKVIE